MRRVLWLLPLLLLLGAVESPAMQLHWSTGATDLEFTSAVRCTLLVQADSAATLPPSWRLLWVADTSAVGFVALDSTAACFADTASVASIDSTGAPGDSIVRITAHFCSSPGGTASTATYLIDLPAASHGKLEAVALDPTDPDSTQVIRSNEVTFNGGIVGDYPPAILRAVSTHPSDQYTVTAYGANLGSINAMSIAAPDSTWRAQLAITSQTFASVTAAAALAADVPACLLEAETSRGAVSGADLPADTPLPSEPALTQYSVARLIEPFLKYPNGFPRIHLGDFTMVWARSGLHVFYTRADQTGPPDLICKNFGHAHFNTASLDTARWDSLPRDTTVLQVPGGTAWDGLHVWAPSIFKRDYDITYYMFYTGVQQNGSNQDQSIGYATSTDLYTWARGSQVLRTTDIPWAMKSSWSYHQTQQLRDPFVTEYPAGSGQYLMYFTTVVDSLTVDYNYSPPDSFSPMAIGVAESRNLLTWTPDPTYLHNTHTTRWPGIAESPHVFADSTRWWLFATYQGSSVRLQTISTSGTCQRL